MSNDDVFDCFGSDSESDTSDAPHSNCTAPYTPAAAQVASASTRIENPSSIHKKINKSSNKSATRDESCGVLAFHPNTEQSLLMHVRNSILSSSHRNNDHYKTLCSSTSSRHNHHLSPAWEQVLHEIDWYCLHRHWMMCIGPEKGMIVRDALESAIVRYQEAVAAAGGGKRRFLAVELGTYCGYGSIFLSQVWKKRFQATSPNINFQLLTVEINPEFSKVAREIIELAQIQDIVTVIENDLLMDGSTADVGKLIRKSLLQESNALTSCSCQVEERQEDYIQFLMIDHDKDSYLKDLQILEKSGLIRRGTVVVADNVIFAGIDEYMDYMHGLAESGIVQTCTKQASVEYCSPDVNKDDHGNGLSVDMFRDGVEITEYLQDPVS